MKWKGEMEGWEGRNGREWWKRRVGKKESKRGMEGWCRLVRVEKVKRLLNGLLVTLLETMAAEQF